MNEFAEGKVLLISKPLHWTSFDAVKKIRSSIKIPKVGHAGTLDPLATGLLIVCTGKFTKKINEYMGMEKEYEGTFTLGATTASYDLETTPENFKPYQHLTNEEIFAATKNFVGNIQQIPPQFSAIKKDGKVSYIQARKGIEVKHEPRNIIIYSFEIIKIELPIIHFKIVCSTGTYIRSIANDYGNAVGTGAYLSSLVRTRIGIFSLTDAFGIEEFIDYVKQQQIVQ